MEMKLLILFIIMNMVNVVIQTIKSIATIKCGKWGAAIINALAYGLYTYVVVLTMCDLPLLWKCLIVAGANFVGVYVVKFFEEKARRDKLWKVEATVSAIEDAKEITGLLARAGIPYNYIDINRYVLINCYCATQKQSRGVKSILDTYNAKYFVSESKSL